MTNLSPVSELSEEDASGSRQNLHNYDVAFTHLAGYINAVVDEDKVPSVEIAKAELAFAVARLRFIAGEAIWRGASVDFEQELQTLLDTSSKHGLNSEIEQGTIRSMFSTVTYWAGYLTGALHRFPQYRGTE